MCPPLDYKSTAASTYVYPGINNFYNRLKKKKSGRHTDFKEIEKILNTKYDERDNLANTLLKDQKENPKNLERSDRRGPRRRSPPRIKNLSKNTIKFKKTSL